MPRVQVAIIGAGPAGLALGRLLSMRGISTIILEARDRQYVEQRVRAGVLEPGTVDLMATCGVDARLRAEGLVQDTFDLRFDGRSHHIPVRKLSGKAMIVYGQGELVKDLIGARLNDGQPVLFEARDVRLGGVVTRSPTVSYIHDGEEHRVDCDLIAGCDGFHGPSRGAIPADILRVYEHVYPFAWLGILARVAPSSHELVYTRHEKGFALLTLRTPELTRLYFQCPPETDPAGWSDAQVWEELHTRLTTVDGFRQTEGPVLEKVLTQLRSFVVEPMQYGRLFIAGDAAHIVPPTGAKGLNLALGDVRILSQAMCSFLLHDDEAGLRGYSQRCLGRIWRTQQFSWQMTALLHRFPGEDQFRRRLQLAQLEHIVNSRSAATALVESYIGLDP